MSLHRENVTWFSPAEGKYRIALFAHHVTGEDHEWDVEYDYDTLVDVYAGDTEEAAYDQLLKENANPGGTTIEMDPDRIEQLDRMAAEAIAERREIQRGWF